MNCTAILRLSSAVSRLSSKRYARATRYYLRKKRFLSGKLCGSIKSLRSGF